MKSFLCLSGWDHSQRNSIWKQSARGKWNKLSGEPRKKMQGTKGPEKHANCSPVRKIGVSGLRIISRRRRLLARSRSLRSTAIPKSSAVNTGDREKSERSMYCVVHVERNKEPMELCHRTNSLKVHRCNGTHSCRKTRMKTEPPQVEQQQWVPVSLKRAKRAAEPGADIGVKVNAMFTTDD